MKSPNWTREELILALELYFKTPHNKIDKTNKKIIALSKYLISLPIHAMDVRAKTFRNVAGVVGKLGNFLPFDKTYKGSGRKRGGKLDPIVFYEFLNRHDALEKEANTIRKIYNEILSLPKKEQVKIISIEDKVDETTGFEGGITYKTHKYIERDSSIVRRKKRNILKIKGKLVCEVCSFNFKETYGERGEGFAECHHIKPLYTLSAKTKTIESDLAILCANCHRMIHKKPYLSINELKHTLT